MIQDVVFGSKVLKGGHIGDSIGDDYMGIFMRMLGV